MEKIHISRNNFFYHLEMKEYQEFILFLDQIEKEMSTDKEVIVYERYTKSGFPPKEIEVPMMEFENVESFKKYREKLESLFDL